MTSLLRSISALLLLAAVSAGALGADLLVPAAGAAGDRQTVARWRSDRIEIAVSASIYNSITNFKPGTDVLGALDRAIEHWEKAANVQIVYARSEKLNVSPSGVKGDGVSLLTIAQTPENLALFNDGDMAISAKTRTFTDRRGNVTESDVILNPYALFSTDGSFGTYDLETVLTHEIGHVLGLRHSAVRGSVMHENVDLNSVVGPSAGTRKALSAEDIAQVRGLYGPAKTDTECCGTVTGRFTGVAKDASPSVVLEDATGQIAAKTKLSSTREFSAAGLEKGRYVVLLVDDKHRIADAEIGVVDVSAGGTAFIEQKVASGAAAFHLDYVGSDGLLSTSAVKLAPGSMTTILVGGSHLNARDLAIYSSSKFITVVRESVADVDYADGVSALRFTVQVAPEAPAGSYSLFGMTADGSFSILAGGIAVGTR